MNAARIELLNVFLDARSLIALPDNKFLWSSWHDAETALREIDGLLAVLRRGGVPSRIEMSVVFAPTGPMQDLSIDSGWADEFLTLAARFDTAEKLFHRQLPWWRRLLD